MATKKITMNKSSEAAGDAWVKNRDTSGTATEKEEMKRLTVDIPLSLHRRIKGDCGDKGLVMADEIRILLEKRWPPKKQQS